MQDYCSEETSKSETADQYGHTPLSQLEKRLAFGLLPGMMDKKSIVFENVDKSHAISGDEDMLAFIIGGLKTNAMYFTSGCSVRVEAVYFKEELQQRESPSAQDDATKAFIIVFSRSPQNAA